MREGRNSHCIRKNILTVRYAKRGLEGRTTSPLQYSSSEHIYYYVVQSTLQILRYDFILHLGKEQNRCPYKGQFNHGKITIRQELTKVTVTHGQPNNVKASWLSFAVMTSDLFRLI